MAERKPSTSHDMVKHDIVKKGGYPSSSKPNSQLKPPPPSISKPKSKAS
jgi:hypothetical protein